MPASAQFDVRSTNRSRGGERRATYQDFAESQPAQVSIKWLRDQLGRDETLRLIDVSFQRPSAARPLLLPQSVYLDWEAMFTEGPGVHPSPLVLASVMSQLGIGDDHIIVVYDEGSGIRALAVYRWLRRFGHSRTFVLQGGRSEWTNQGHALANVPVSFDASSFTVRISRTPSTKPERTERNTRRNASNHRESRRRAA
jgi:thiosulfate/3-mercaptopyruvate sulfurtransferase